MYVTEHLAQATGPQFSHEIIPPSRGKDARDILSIVERIIPYHPAFIDVTSHAAEAAYEEQPDGTVIRRVRKKRPGTISICGIIQNRYSVDTVPHLLCRGFSREETEDVMIELNYLGIHNVLAIRGDETNYRPSSELGHSVNSYAADLVQQLSDLRRGQFLGELSNSAAMPICVGVGGYPEKHAESPNQARDIQYLKAKVDAGADYIVTQMFFDNAAFFTFVDRCRVAGISAPIVPGIKIIHHLRHLNSLPKNFNISLPEALVNEILASPAHIREIGIRWAIRQVTELVNAGFLNVHFYIMNDADSVCEVMRPFMPIKTLTTAG